MNFHDDKMREAMRERAAALPSLLEGEREPIWSLRLRPSNYWALFADGKYFRTTGLMDEASAQTYFERFKLQREALQDGTVDVRRSSATAIIDHRIKMVKKKQLRGAPVIEATLEALKPHVKGRQLRHLSDAWLEATEEAMRKRYSRTYFTNCIYYFRTAIRGWCRACTSPQIMPFEAPPRRDRRTTVLLNSERDRIVRWAKGTEDYDAKTGRWTRRSADLSEREANMRQVAYRQTYLGLVFGSRPGVYERLAWEPHAEGGHLDLEAGIFHRVPLGARTPSNKKAPPTPIPPKARAELARWRKQDAGSPWVFREVWGTPLSQRRQQKITSKAMARLGIKKVTGHTLRHTAITRLIEKGEPAAAISATVGISVQMLHARYNHSDNRAVQKLALKSIDNMMK